MLQMHCKYNAVSDAASGIAHEDSHHELNEEELRLVSHEDPSRDAIRRHLAKFYLEVVVLVEGIEPTTSSSLQARHSYVVGLDGQDFEWDKTFVECCSFPHHDAAKGMVFDFGNFHKLVDSCDAHA
jgi:hypothetical protein